MSTKQVENPTQIGMAMPAPEFLENELMATMDAQSTEATFTPVKEKINFGDLMPLGSGSQQIRQFFDKYFKSNPDGVCVNNETAFNSVKPSITSRYGHWCYKHMQAPVFDTPKLESDEEVILGSEYAYNEGNDPITVELKVEGKREQRVNLTWDPMGINMRTEATLKTKFEAGGEVTINTRLGHDSRSHQETPVTTTVRITVPPRSKQKVEILGRSTTESNSVVVPITVDGWFGANFPHRVNGHYFWFLNTASGILPRTQANWRGIIRVSSVFNTRTRVHPAEPIK